MLKKIVLSFFCLVLVAHATLGQKVEEKNVPADIRSVATAQLNGHVDLWILDKARNKYVASVMNEAVFRPVEISLTGKWLATTDALPESKIPTVVMKTIREKYLNKGFEGSNYQFVRDSKAASFYSVELISDDGDIYVKLNEKGQVVHEEER